jgi:hypothetical protein
MIVRCSNCEAVYDDESCWTICPHNPLYVNPDKKLCREHDLFDCPFHPGQEHLTGNGRVAPLQKVT